MMSAVAARLRPSVERSPGSAIRHPLALVALALWLVNDHLLKGNGPGWLTGKLSDVACLIVVPLIPVAAVELVRSQRRDAWEAGAVLRACAVAATGAVMVTINLWDAPAWAYRHGLAALQWPFLQIASLAAHGQLSSWRPVHLTMDASDLWTLPALLIPWWLSSRATVEN